MEELSREISQRFGSLSDGQKAVARYVIDNHRGIALMNIGMVADRAGVSRPTVVRFAKAIGYSGFSEMKSTLGRRMLARLTTPERFRSSLASGGNASQIVSRVIGEDLNNLRETQRQLDPQVVDDLVQRIVESNAVYVAGAGGSLPAAHFLAEGLRPFLRFVEVVSGVGETPYSRLLWTRPGDLVIAISFPRYFRSTIDAIRFANDRGVGTVAITDRPSAPAALEAEMALFVTTERRSMRVSMPVAFTVLEAIALAVGHMTPDSAERVEALARKNDPWVIDPPAQEGERIAPLSTTPEGGGES